MKCLFIGGPMDGEITFHDDPPERLAARHEETGERGLYVQQTIGEEGVGNNPMFGVYVIYRWKDLSVDEFHVRLGAHFSKLSDPPHSPGLRRDEP